MELVFAKWIFTAAAVLNGSTDLPFLKEVTPQQVNIFTSTEVYENFVKEPCHPGANVCPGPLFVGRREREAVARGAGRLGGAPGGLPGGSGGAGLCRGQPAGGLAGLRLLLPGAVRIERPGGGGGRSGGVVRDHRALEPPPREVELPVVRVDEPRGLVSPGVPAAGVIEGVGARE